MTTDKRDGGELLPCPLCGEDAAVNTCRTSDPEYIRLNKRDTGYGVNCPSCGLNNRGIAIGYATEALAIAAWNRRANVERALAEIRAECERLKRDRDDCLAAREHYAGLFGQQHGRAERLAEALRELSDAVFAEFCSGGTEEYEPDDSKVSYPEDRCHITFGMIRRARAALNLEPTP